ncbi:MAG: NADP-dependent 3-hydroxy acid dehydrogenase YdfG [Phormidesmis priestleyi Ana]|uniref:NADP-dependent 3-hydroxy acid dehydrogenase YdfG n=1 Tax=Phormidesmis priestleyi Ana TaxID=1666911 RepID=A0A0P8BR81_9CYAN|nr:MAG: NADP-dependent 3-hydroxy acid dehydrogenase YdfG [Phormidesmis priestleyi Ana]
MPISFAHKLTDKIVLITGASSGIGEACAHYFAEAGARLILCARREGKLQALADDLQQKYSVKTFLLPLDIQQSDAINTAIANLPESWQAINILINNAGLSRGLDKQYIAPLQDWEEMIDTNVKGLLYMTRAIVPGMVERNSGHVINIGSVAARYTYPGGSVYCATKAAVKVLTEGLKIDLLGTPIRVTNIEPGMVETEFSDVRFRGDTDRAKSVYSGITALTADDIADSILYAATRPLHVNISEIYLLATDQSTGTLIHRREQP